jgi:hypothetical protein
MPKNWNKIIGKVVQDIGNANEGKKSGGNMFSSQTRESSFRLIIIMLFIMIPSKRRKEKVQDGSEK